MWQALQRATAIRDPKKEANMLAAMVSKGYSELDALEMIEDSTNDELWLNDTYQVAKRVLLAEQDGQHVEIIHLSIKRRDGGTAKDWRDFQCIKNQLAGQEIEMVELYPAESRLVDSANQYHLWGFNLAGWHMPFGWEQGRFVVDDFDEGTGVSQRPLG